MAKTAIYKKVTSLQNLERDELEILLIEYQKTQDSAQHHDNLIWNVSNILMIASGGLLLFLLQNLHLKWIFWLFIFGIVLSFSSLLFFNSLKMTRNLKYDRLKNIEENCILNLEGAKILNQHSNLKIKPIISQTYFFLWISLITLYIIYFIWFLCTII